MAKKRKKKLAKRLWRAARPAQSLLLGALGGAAVLLIGRERLRTAANPVTGAR